MNLGRTLRPRGERRERNDWIGSRRLFFARQDQRKGDRPAERGHSECPLFCGLPSPRSNGLLDRRQLRRLQKLLRLLVRDCHVRANVNAFNGRHRATLSLPKVVTRCRTVAVRGYPASSAVGSQSTPGGTQMYTTPPKTRSQCAPT